MNPLPLSRIAQWTNGRLLGDDAVVDAVLTDTRTLAPGEGRNALFIALKGANFDGNDHVAAAAALGVRAALVSRPGDAALAQIVVADTGQALAAFAAALQRIRTGKVVGITGSNGKTTVKQLVHAILEKAGTAYANPGNRNNEIGLPLAVIEADPEADFSIYEMGAGKPGDIAWLTAIARPDVALVNNVAPAHLERMGSLLGIADTKAAIYDALPPDGVAVINADDAFAPYFAERAHGRRLLRFGLEATADVSARDILQDADGARFVLVSPQGEAAVALPLAGRHNVGNALAAAAIALALEVPLATVAAGLAAVRPVAGRLVRHPLGAGAALIDDSYNANPGSLAAAIDTLASAGGQRWLVLGDMRELGDDAQALHAAAGQRARAAGIDRLYALGSLSAAAVAAFGADGRHFDSHDAVAAALADDLAAAAKTGTVAPSPVTLLVKGSRGSAMERVVERLLQRQDQGDNHDAA